MVKCYLPDIAATDKAIVESDRGCAFADTH
jgi:hypothetical protein